MMHNSTFDSFVCQADLLGFENEFTVETIEISISFSNFSDNHVLLIHSFIIFYQIFVNLM